MHLKRKKLINFWVFLWQIDELYIYMFPCTTDVEARSLIKEVLEVFFVIH